jgi:hypothetical protein
MPIIFKEMDANICAQIPLPLSVVELLRSILLSDFILSLLAAPLGVKGKDQYILRIPKREVPQSAVTGIRSNPSFNDVTVLGSSCPFLLNT